MYPPKNQIPLPPPKNRKEQTMMNKIEIKASLSGKDFELKCDDVDLSELPINGVVVEIKPDYAPTVNLSMILSKQSIIIENGQLSINHIEAPIKIERALYDYLLEKHGLNWVKELNDA